ncbi:hypothetical protein ANCDUO_23039 [Ancylostoma duodenale]|uniref:Uncharacterized protein n=1 Tax=Ancylostoma duodenale TaxID=51022 RepID=A0A0C2FEE1_9BILA|nr:hypothetical protein ANCDUO_23039 [Ancylostoma duodenale]
MDVVCPHCQAKKFRGEPPGMCCSGGKMSSFGTTATVQIYFMGDEEQQVNQRCGNTDGTRRNIVLNLQRMFHRHNNLVNVFKTALERMPTDEYRIVIRADKRPAGELERRFNAPTVDKVAVIMVGDEFDRRDIIIQKRNDSLQRILETHRSYDAL